MRSRRDVPPRTPRLPGTIWPGVIRASTRGSRSLVRPSLRVTTRVATSGDSDQVRIHISVSVEGPERLQDVRVWLNGEALASHDLGQGRYMASGDAAIADHQRIYSEWSKPSGSLVVVYARDVTGAEAGDFSVVEALPVWRASRFSPADARWRRRPRVRSWLRKTWRPTSERRLDTRSAPVLDPWLQREHVGTDSWSLC